MKLEVTIISIQIAKLKNEILPNFSPAWYNEIVRFKKWIYFGINKDTLIYLESTL